MKGIKLAVCCSLAAIFAISGALDAEGGKKKKALPLTASTAQLEASEIDGLMWMREEEKLAHDVYVTLNEIWNQRIFRNIIKSEQAHMDAVKGLLDAYQLDDPVDEAAIGVFPSQEFQFLYDSLVDSGSRSLQNAYLAGVRIEEMDIKDLEAWILATDNPDILTVYNNLLSASQSHLSAFTSHL